MSENNEVITVSAEEASPDSQATELVEATPVAVNPTVVQDFGGDNDFSMGDTIKSSKMEKFKLQEGETARIAFVLINAEGHPVFKQNKTFYHEPTRKTVKVPDEDTPANRDLLAFITKKVGKVPKPKFSFVVAKYTMAGNKLLTEDVELKALVIPEEKFKALKVNHQEMGLGEHDIIVQCVDAKYQDYNFISCKERILDGFKEVASIASEATQLYNDGLPLFMGIPMDAKEITDLLSDPTDDTMEMNANPFASGEHPPLQVKLETLELLHKL